MDESGKASGHLVVLSTTVNTVGETRRQRKRTNQIDVEMCKTASWHRSVGSLESDMAMDLTFLA
jgi:hypothetical protein